MAMTQGFAVDLEPTTTKGMLRSLHILCHSMPGSVAENVPVDSAE